jgi:hypothetical protein
MAAWAYERHTRPPVSRNVCQLTEWVAARRPTWTAPEGPWRRLPPWAWPPWPKTDDKSLQGAPAPTMLAFAAITTHAASLVLHSQAANTGAHSKDIAAASAVRGQLGVRHAPEGVLGPKTPAFQTANAKSCGTRACHLMDKLLALLLGDQDCSLVLYGSLQKCVANLPWGCTWEPSGAPPNLKQSGR